jgi:hypothetical protein
MTNSCWYYVVLFLCQFLECFFHVIKVTRLWCEPSFLILCQTMINASVQKKPVVVSCDTVLNLAPIVVRTLSEVAVAIHDLGNQLINFGNFTSQFESLLVIRCIFIFFFFCCFIFLLSGFFSDAQGNGVGSGGVVVFVCSFGQSFCFQWCPVNSGHGFIAFFLQQGIQFDVGEGIATRHFLVLNKRMNGVSKVRIV